MFSFASSFFNYLLSRDEDQDEEDDQIFEAKLAEMQMQDVLKNNDYTNESEDEFPEAPIDKNCFRKTGVISYIDTNSNYVLIDGAHYFDMSSCSIKLNLNDKVSYLGYHKHDNQLAIVRILENEGHFWGDEGIGEEIIFTQTDHTLIGQVDHREGRIIFMTNGDIKFNLDEVDGTFVPIPGDVLEMNCKVRGNDNKVATSITSKEVLEVIAFRPLGLKITTGTIMEWNGEYGLCGKKIYFDRQCLSSGIEPKVGSKVIMKTIESYQDKKCIYRAIELQVTSDNNQNAVVEADDEEESTIELENNHKLEITHLLTFDLLELQQRSQISLKVTNKSDETHVINKWIILSKKRDSQVNITPILQKPYKLFPGHSFSFTIECQPKFLGKAKEQLLVMFRGFKVKRTIHINVATNSKFANSNDHNGIRRSELEKYVRMKNIRDNDNDVIVHGRKINRTRNFVAMKLGMFKIPEKMWTVVLGDSDQLRSTVDYSKILNRIEDTYPFLAQDLNIYNYSDKLHTLVYMEEIQETISMRSFDIEKTYMIRCHEYLSLEIKGLSERRPSLIEGDRAIVKDIYDAKASKYEGCIHEVRGNRVLMKFCQAFHESYSGADVSVEFYFSRTSYRRCHNAINLAISNLGPDILFPRRVTTHPYQVPPENLNTIEWFNEKLNTGQKAAITNILLGECRPKPYCIYGPPGTGKTVTVVETILQILKNIPHSRILVATPSNSAADLITERLIDYKEKNPYSLVRIIAYYLVKSDNIPPNIKSYCVTVDIAKEGTSMSRQDVHNGVQVNCQSTFIGRHRVTIGTCGALGVLSQMEFPKGHFTHVIVDEAGQATEAEILIPLTLTDKDNGQIILAGDPMQLGPVVKSSFCQEFGMGESYLTRILDTFPYQKDFAAFQSGFNEKLVTKLNDNYRSLKEVLSLPSEMFYDGSLVERIDRKQEWIERLINITSEIFETGDSKAGGIFVHGVRGCNTRADDSPSWYNPQEATMVALTVSKIYKRNVTADEIGIITPYIAQIKYLRSLFEGMGLPQPKIGTVEEFQGQEKPLILISTVRSTETLVQEDIKNTLGFVKNPKRLNVALTRAQVAVILFCDPHLLCTDPLWSRIVINAIKEDKYMGCDMPKVSF